MNSIDKLGRFIKESRIEAGMSQEELAELLDVTPTHVKHLESGHRKPSVEVLFAIALELNMSVDSIVFPTLSAQSFMTRKIANALSDCTPSEQKVTFDLIQSLKKNR